eukprot:CAMPEP_0171105508 /NCGR_PEP_ID=MMETSP0766_2-20121228/62830_1 /TAXON_ID=439317 /ORGANISM="Gambierdiscus australes, Strain CAWD 149" /LENGTH=37 /DNA_ID= /DNA_START= /DNA_END= /DNA_ORIENTATION=
MAQGDIVLGEVRAHSDAPSSKLSPGTDEFFVPGLNVG